MSEVGSRKADSYEACLSRKKKSRKGESWIERRKRKEVMKGSYERRKKEMKEEGGGKVGRWKNEGWKEDRMNESTKIGKMTKARRSKGRKE